MQEIAILISSLAGVATAAAVRKSPKKTQLLSLGASSHIKNQINSLKIEKDILTKTISRLYQYDSDISKIQRDKLLVKYQHQLGIILAKLEKLEDASNHPDLGPVGDGLITLMDQKLSRLDDRLYELSSKLQVAKISIPEIKKDETEKIKDETAQETKIETKPKKDIINFEKPNPVNTQQIVIPTSMERQSFELTTLTKLSKKEPKFPLFEKQIQVKKEIGKGEILEELKIQENLEIPKKVRETPIILGPKPDLVKEVEKITKFKALPEPKIEKQNTVQNLEDEFDEDSDDIDKIKNEIMNVLSKLDQAEVE